MMGDNEARMEPTIEPDERAPRYRLILLQPDGRTPNRHSDDDLRMHILEGQAGIDIDAQIAGLPDGVKLLVLSEYEGDPMGVYVRGHHLDDRSMLALIASEIYAEAIKRNLTDDLPPDPLVIRRGMWVDVDMSYGDVMFRDASRLEDDDVPLGEPYPVTVCDDEWLAGLADELGLGP